MFTGFFDLSSFLAVKTVHAFISSFTGKGPADIEAVYTQEASPGCGRLS